MSAHNMLARMRTYLVTCSVLSTYHFQCCVLHIVLLLHLSVCTKSLLAAQPTFDCTPAAKRLHARMKPAQHEACTRCAMATRAPGVLLGNFQRAQALSRAAVSATWQIHGTCRSSHLQALSRAAAIPWRVQALYDGDASNLKAWLYKCPRKQVRPFRTHGSWLWYLIRQVGRIVHSLCDAASDDVYQ